MCHPDGLSHGYRTQWTSSLHLPLALSGLRTWLTTSSWRSLQRAGTTRSRVRIDPWRKGGKVSRRSREIKIFNWLGDLEARKRKVMQYCMGLRMSDSEMQIPKTPPTSWYSATDNGHPTCRLADFLNENLGTSHDETPSTKRLLRSYGSLARSRDPDAAVPNIRRVVHHFFF